MGKAPVARLLQPAIQKQKPLTRAEAECKLAKVLGNGNRDLYAKYVRKRTYELSRRQIQLFAEKFVEGDQFDFEKTFERLFGGRPQRECRGYQEPPPWNWFIHQDS
jgi:hypothetical protein